MSKIKKAFLAFALTTMAFSASAAGKNCKEVSFADIGWTDVTATTAVTSEILKGIGYETKIDLLSVPVTFSSLSNGDVDVFLGNWMPTQVADIEKYTKDGTIKTVRANLEGAKYTLAVPQYVYDAGVKDFSDIVKFKDKFKGRIYGIEPGNDGNRLLQLMIDKNDFGLKGFKLVESSEAGMLSQVTRAVRRDEWIVFLGWAPHPMNSNTKMSYLTGGDNYFGPNFGGSSVFTNVRANYLTECPNVGAFLKNLQFSLEMESEVMGAILDDKQKPAAAAKAWLAKHPEQVKAWLKGVKTIDGKPAAEAVMQSLK